MGTILSLKRKKVKGSRSAKPKKINKNCQLQEAWVWPEKVENKIRSLLLGRSINICSGLSSLGDVKVDLEPRDPDVLKAEMENLPFDDETFDSVLSDPPWKTNFFHRQKPFFIILLGGPLAN